MVAAGRAQRSLAAGAARLALEDERKSGECHPETSACGSDSKWARHVGQLAAAAPAAAVGLRRHPARRRIPAGSGSIAFADLLCAFGFPAGSAWPVAATLAHPPPHTLAQQRSLFSR